MITASQLRAGMAVRFEGQPYKVVACDYRPGQGQMGGAAHARLKNLATGTYWEHSFRAELKLETLPVEKRSLEFLYADADHCYFMDPETFDQVVVPLEVAGQPAKFLEPQMNLTVEFVEDRPVSVLFPDILEVRIADTAPPSHAQADSAWKPARLENGVAIMAPQFIKSGDLIRLDVENLKYVDRAKVSGH
jgi:elongation factor P